MPIEEPNQLSKVIRHRQTWKVLGDPSQPVKFEKSVTDQCDQKIREAIATAGWAPFHYDRSVDGIAEPWRVHFVGQVACRRIANEFPKLFSDIKPGNKLPAMLSACGALLLVTWLPQFRGDADANSEGLTLEKQRLVDDEHIFATGAMIQNLLLLLTAAGLGTYWSSGGQLGSPPMFERLSISDSERLAAAIFVEYPNGQGKVIDRIAGKNRDRRSASQAWLNEIMS